jgi:hypothetical protein
MSGRLINTKYNVGDKVYRATTWCEPSKEPATITDIDIYITKKKKTIQYIVNDRAPLINEEELYSTYEEARAFYVDHYLKYLEDEYGDYINEYLKLKKEKEDAEN